MYKLSVMYRDADNWKDFYEVVVSPVDYPEIKTLKAGDEIEMGDYGTQTEDEFFGGDNHEQAYNPEYDHNILEVLEVQLCK